MENSQDSEVTVSEGYLGGIYTAKMPTNCLRAIYEDSRKFCSTRLLPSHFLQDVIEYPVSVLSDIMGDVMYARHIERVNFPEAWKEKPTFTPPQGLPPTPGSAGATGGGSSAQSLEHVHPKLRKELTAFHAKFGGRPMLSQLLDEAQMRLGELPKLDSFVDSDGKNRLCYGHVLGRCRFGKNCNNAESHHEGRSLPNSFVEDLCKAIRPGVEKLMRPEYEVPKEQKPRASRDAKRQRR